MVEIEGLKDPSASEGYARWRDLAASAMPCVRVKSPQIIVELIKRKRDNNEEELRRQGNVGRNDCWKKIKEEHF